MLIQPISSAERYARLATHLWILLTLLLVTACEKSVKPESDNLVGRWEGFVSYGAPPNLITGDLVLIIDENNKCDVDGIMSGSILPWGDFDFYFTGALTVNVNHTALGEITFTRCRSGIDTVHVVGTMAGQFDLSAGYVMGSWHTDPDAAFSLGGDWGAMKKD